MPYFPSLVKNGLKHSWGSFNQSESCGIFDETKKQQMKRCSFLELLIKSEKEYTSYFWKKFKRICCSRFSETHGKYI